MGSHIINGQFQSDKYPTCPPGKVPLSVKDPTCQDLLWEYAQRRRLKDPEFSSDLEVALIDAGYDGSQPPKVSENLVLAEHFVPTDFYDIWAPEFVLQIPDGAEFLGVHVRNGDAYLSVLHDPSSPAKSRNLITVQAGHRVPTDFFFVGTFVQERGERRSAHHVFVETRP